jgi:hypothetical protein
MLDLSTFTLTSKGQDFLKDAKVENYRNKMPTIVDILESIETRSNPHLTEEEEVLVGVMGQSGLIERRSGDRRQP